MPKRTDINSVLIIGAGPIVIGQACEFDYSGAQACKALREEGYKVILVNSNPATIMTDPDMADATYIEPVDWQTVRKIIEQERPDALLPTMGGQTALNCALDLDKQGVLKEYGVEMIGASKDAIDKAEDRELFRKAMLKIGLSMPRSEIASDIEQAKKALDVIGFPAIIRPSFTLGGTGGGIAYDEKGYFDICEKGLDASPVSEILIEESALGWKEYEMEVVRDSNDNCIIVCSIENLDPMGVHTGDSITLAPAQTLTDKEYQIMRDASIKVLREIGVDTGGSNVQFAINPDNGELIIIEMNPRVSRSSALASKATGFPIAKVAAKLAVGFTLDELKNEITGGATPASFEPTIDYIVTKIPRFTFEKFPQADDRLTTQMKSVGEVMAIGLTFQESLQKAICGLETNVNGLNQILSKSEYSYEKLEKELSAPGANRLWYVADAFRYGLSVEDVFNITKIDPWFLRQINDLINTESQIEAEGLKLFTHERLVQFKKMGFSDSRLAELTCKTESKIRSLRAEKNIRPVFKRVDSCAAEFESTTAYMYSCYSTECEAVPSKRKKIMVLGGGPNRIGQGIELDYCCVQAAFAMRDAGYETIMVNCNPETVSTDYDTSDRLYFEPLTLENVLEIINIENPFGVIVQYGGQTPLKLARELENEGVPIIGTSPDSIDLAEDRERFQKLLNEIGLTQPPNEIARNTEQAVKSANKIGFPLVVRPSYVLGGRAMEIVYNNDDLKDYMEKAVQVSHSSPVLLDRFLNDAIEVDIDVISDGKDVFIGAIMEHIEEAGIHSGDSGCSIPPYTLSDKIISKLRTQVTQLALELNVIGLMNTQFAIKDQEIYLLEVNPRASRTAPFVSKAIGIQLAKAGALVMSGKSLKELNLGNEVVPTYFSVKEAVLPFSKFPEVDVLLGPEMKSTGEVMGIGHSFGEAYFKAQRAAGVILPKSGNVFLSVRDKDKPAVCDIARDLKKIGFELFATKGTQLYLDENNINCQRVNKVKEGQPHIVDMIKNGDVHLIINTTEGARSINDSFSIRKEANNYNVCLTTTISGAKAFCKAILFIDNFDATDIQSLHKNMDY